MESKDIKTLAYVMRRTNYGEADRIINFITPVGKISAIAKGVRKPKSKLAGGLEMFSLVEINVHKGRSTLYTVTSTKMVRYFSNLVRDFERMELAGFMLKKVSFASDNSDSPDFFKIIDSGVRGLDLGVSMQLAQSWFLLNFLKATGEEVNLYFDTSGEKLSAEMRYNFNAMEGAFMPRANGKFGANEIKMLRLMLSADLELCAKVKNFEAMMPKILEFARIVNKMC